MPREEDEDIYDEEFDFVDDEEEGEDRALDSDIAEEPAAEERRPRARQPSERREDDLGEEEAGADQAEEPVDEYGRPEPAANYVVHIYENKKFKRTIERPFTPEEAEAFATEYNRTAKSYGRVATPGKNDAKPKKALD
jgi:hypothetical protein